VRSIPLSKEEFYLLSSSPFHLFFEPFFSPGDAGKFQQLFGGVLSIFSIYSLFFFSGMIFPKPSPALWPISRVRSMGNVGVFPSWMVTFLLDFPLSQTLLRDRGTRCEGWTGTRPFPFMRGETVRIYVPLFLPVALESLPFPSSCAEQKPEGFFFFF